MILQIHTAHTVLWLALALALLNSKTLERYELADAIQAALQALGEPEIGLVGDMTRMLKQMILSGAEATPGIDPGTTQTLEDIFAAKNRPPRV